jgi:hypothetical protein
VNYKASVTQHWLDTPRSKMIFVESGTTQPFLVKQDVGMKDIRFDRHPDTRSCQASLHRTAEVAQRVHVMQYVDAEGYVECAVLHRVGNDVSDFETDVVPSILLRCE